MHLDALIIDANATTRSYLWQAMLAEPHFRRVKAVSTPVAALNYLRAGHRFDVVLPTSSLSQEAIKRFVRSARCTPGGAEAAYVVVLRPSDQTAEVVAFGIIDGTDGFLLEPYSVMTLQQVAAIAIHVKREHELARKRAGIRLLTEEAIKALSSLAAARACEEDDSFAKRALVEASASLMKLETDERELYYEILPDVLSEAAPRTVSYRGASKRLRKRLNKRRAT